ncbi:hypothetical protein CLOM_g20045 [Closterium sp. NIES-68]|nr:hypothetical protein CLOM_g20045 [Closterium sp. NIES-68]GJP73919.1 hypothetical protein CLOP_g4586 [Closterium sp. NIES-67]
MTSSAAPRPGVGARALSGSANVALALTAAGATINGGISAVVGAGGRGGGPAGSGASGGAGGQAPSPKGTSRGASSPRAPGGIFPRHAAVNYLCLMLPFLALSTLQLYLMWLPELGPMRLPEDDFVGSKGKKSSREHRFNYRTLLAHTASDVLSLHKLLERNRHELKGEVADGMERMGLEMLQTKQDSARAAADVADWWRHEQGRLKAMSEDIGQLKKIVGQHARSLEAQVQAAQGGASSSGEEHPREERPTEGEDNEELEESGLARPEQWHPSHQAFQLFWITDDRPTYWQQRTFQRYGSYGFIKFSAYRVNASTIAVLGLASLPMHQGRRFTSCRWHAKPNAGGDNGGSDNGGVDNGGGDNGSGNGGGDSSGGVTEGRLVPLYVEEHHEYLYEAVVLLCVLDAPSPQSGGFLQAEVDGEVFYPFVEPPGQPLDEPSNFPTNLVLCGPPMFGAINPRALTEWLHFHRVLLPVDHFVLYDAGGVANHADVSSALQPWVQARVVEVTGFQEAKQYDVWSYAQALSSHDCMYRHRHEARWLLFADLDEFVEVLPPNTLQQLLQDNAGRPWITFGCTVFNSSFCRPQEQWNGGTTRRRRLLLGEGGLREEYPEQWNGGTARRRRRLLLGKGELRETEKQPHERWNVGAARRRLLLGEEERDEGRASQPFIIEGVKYQWPHPYCMNASLFPDHLCLDQFGHRKYILNPRRVSLAQIHVIIGGDLDGLDLPTDVARFAHYRGLTTRAYPMCDLGRPSKWWQYHDGLAKMAQAARSCPALETLLSNTERERCTPQALARSITSS